MRPGSMWMHRRLCLPHGFCPGAEKPGGNGCRAIMVCKFRVAAVDDRIKPRVLCDASLEIVRYQEPGYAAEIFISMCMAQQPVLRFHVAANLCIRIAAAGKNCDKQISRSACPVTESVMGSVPPAQSTSMASPGLWWIRIVAFDFFAQE